MSCLDCHDFMDGYNRGKREGIIEELEKIKTEIRKLTDINPDYPMDKTIHISRYEVQKIIYERIAELKGEVE